MKEKEGNHKGIRTPFDLYHHVATKIIVGIEKTLKRLPVRIKKKKEKTNLKVFTNPTKEKLSPYYTTNKETKELEPVTKSHPSHYYYELKHKEMEKDVENEKEKLNEIEPIDNKAEERQQELEDLRADKSEEQERDIDR